MRPGHRSSRRPPPGGKGAAKPAWLTPTATPEPKPEPRPKPIWPAPGRASYPSWRPVDSRRQLVWRVQRPQVHLDLVVGAAEQRRPTTGAEMPAGIVARFTVDRHGILREYRRSVK
ncbi:hypothetical protein G6F68_018402 [Rhizopus microsporus]|nr:hypothetical protein G6F68_018402 [Rhizopus microsporus]